MIKKDDTVSVSPHQVSATLADESIVLELQAGTYFGMNDVGTDVWKFLQQPRRVTDVIAHILERYEIEAHRAEAEILRFLEELANKNLVMVERKNRPRDH
jgi:hypothetical protein